MQLRAEEISSIIKKQIRDYHNEMEMNDIGTVMEGGDGIASIYGLEKCMANELLELGNGVYAMALNLDAGSVGAVMLGSDQEIKEGDTVKRTGRVVSVPVGKAMLGRVVNALGQPIDGKGPIEAEDVRPVESPAPGIIERKSVSDNKKI